MRFRLAIVTALTSLLVAALPAAVSAAPQEADLSKQGKGKKKKCKKGKVTVTINGRRLCQPPKSALPPPKAADQRMLAAVAALRVDLGSVRDRRGRKAISPSKLLGAKQTKTAETAIAQSLSTVDRLSLRRNLASSVLPLASASASGCGAGPPQQSRSIKGTGYDASIEIANGAAEIGIGLEGGGIRAEIDLGLCDALGDKFKVDECPSAQGELKGSDESKMYMGIRILRGAEVLFSLKSEFTTTTKIEPIQIDEDAKLEYFEIDHTYRNATSMGGSQQAFGPISLKLAFHGQTRVNFPGATYDPTHTDVDVNLKIGGAQADEFHEIRDIEFEEALTLKRKANEHFASEVDKAIDKITRRERDWQQPNRCAKIEFDPASRALLLQKDQRGSFKARIESKKGGSPETAKWTRLDLQNATVDPATARANPATFNYTVTKVGKGTLVKVKLKAVSHAGVAEDEWIQPTDDRVPPPAKFTGTINGTAEYDATELGAGNSLSAGWTGTVTLQQEPPMEIPGFPTTQFNYKVTSGTIQYGYTGEVSDCHVQGSQPIDLSKQVDIVNTISLVLFDESPDTYALMLPAPIFAPILGEKSSCDEPVENGDDYEWLPAAGLPYFAYSPKGALVDSSWFFAGTNAGNNGPGSPDQEWIWEFTPVP